ncbi:hypothetical protein RND71_036633 [Anisodus tanguticus]|uniref:Secreted protein n=1 Tax=Anisodus tanguticus TaxID=243964 RepID=A0AAE1V018_9SOLA|nr:hypothetical protein RND71_036633 [Anisodus tanguticus]
MDRRSILAFVILTILVCSSLLVTAQDQEPNVVAGQDTTQAQLPEVESGPKKDGGEINHEDDDAGVDSLTRNFYDAEDFGPEIFVAGH